MKIEFSRPVDIARLGRDPINQAIEANADECTALAKRFQISAILKLAGSFSLHQAMGGIYEVSGTVTGLVTQTCIITGEPFDTEIKVSIKARYSETEQEGEESPEDDWDAPELILEQSIDLGELAAQHLSLRLDPYPKKPDARWDDFPDTAKEEVPQKISPFAVLQKLKS